MNKLNFEVKSDSSNGHYVGRATSIHAHISSVSVKVSVGLTDTSNKGFFLKNISHFMHIYFFSSHTFRKNKKKYFFMSVDNNRTKVAVS